MRVLLILVVVVVLAYFLWRRTTPRQQEDESPPQHPATEIQVVCPACGHDTWQVRGRLSPKKALVLICKACGRTISFEGDMARVNQHPGHPKED